jgi:hypothetical protein
MDSKLSVDKGIICITAPVTAGVVREKISGML